MPLRLSSSPGDINAVITSALCNLLSENVACYTEDSFVSANEPYDVPKILKSIFQKKTRHRSHVLRAKDGDLGKGDRSSWTCN